MKALKNFLDVTGRRVKKGDDVSNAYDKATLAHYTRHGLVGTPAEAPAAPAPRRPRQPKPAETKPAAPQEPGDTEAPEFPPADPDRKGGENNPLTEADAAADLAGQPRPE